ncbi:MAG: biotin--[acetyl-CoA-carboxylase] ligase [candidate division Zixibacteria bacterium]|nr:biotin--[acetyl-CoA-carboxylase] ligase [candidate division Zixibacteria bacterium]
MANGKRERLGLLYKALPTNGSASSAELAAASSLAPRELAAAVDELRALGARVAGDERRGYSRELPPQLDADAVANLVEGRLGKVVRVYDSVTSTMAKARELVAEAGSHGVVVLAEEQTAGRGRYGRNWSSPRRLGLYLSSILEKQYLPRGITLLPLLTGVALVDAVASAAALTPKLEWPNDLVWQGAKFGGILIESHGDPAVVVVGVGVNVFQCPFDLPGRVLYPVTSLVMASARDVDRNALAAAVLNELGRWLERWLSAGPEPVLAAWRERNVTLGRRVRIAGTGLAGTALDLTDDGALIIEDDAGRQNVIYSADA